jgi:hypothetical protein
MSAQVRSVGVLPGISDGPESQPFPAGAGYAFPVLVRLNKTAVSR